MGYLLLAVKVLDFVAATEQKLINFNVSQKNLEILLTHKKMKIVLSKKRLVCIKLQFP